jgi:hypothetical protein
MKINVRYICDEDIRRRGSADVVELICALSRGTAGVLMSISPERKDLSPSQAPNNGDLDETEPKFYISG